VEERSVEDNALSVLKFIQQGMPDLLPEIGAVLEKEGTEFQRQSSEAILRAVSDMSPGELYWRHKFFWGQCPLA
jgi:hypothetical protein